MNNYVFTGPFWIIADTLADIKSGNFYLYTYKYLSDSTSGKSSDNVDFHIKRLHLSLWSNLNNKSWNYYPRGRVSVYQDIVYILIPLDCNLDNVINEILKEYCLDGFTIKMEYLVEHYKFQLK